MRKRLRKRIVSFLMCGVLLSGLIDRAPVKAAVVAALPAYFEVLYGLLGSVGLVYAADHLFGSEAPDDWTSGWEPGDWEGWSDADVEDVLRQQDDSFSKFAVNIMDNFNGKKPDEPHSFGKLLKDIALNGAITVAVKDKLEVLSDTLRELLAPSVEFSVPAAQAVEMPSSFFDQLASIEGNFIFGYSIDGYGHFMILSGPRCAYWMQSGAHNLYTYATLCASFYTDGENVGKYGYLSDFIDALVYQTDNDGYGWHQLNNIGEDYPVVGGRGYVRFSSGSDCKNYVLGSYEGEVTPVQPAAPDVYTPDGNLDSTDKINPRVQPQIQIQIPSRDLIEGFIQSIVDGEGLVMPEAVPGAFQNFLEQIEQNTGVDPDPDPDPDPSPDPDPDPDPEPDPDPDIDPDVNASYASPGLDELFPFCIPFDLIDCFKLFSAEAKAPRFEFPLKSERFGIDEVVVVDLSPFEPVAVIFRVLMIIAFIIGLILVTRNLIGS